MSLVQKTHVRKKGGPRFYASQLFKISGHLKILQKFSEYKHADIIHICIQRLMITILRQYTYYTANIYIFILYIY